MARLRGRADDHHHNDFDNEHDNKHDNHNVDDHNVDDHNDNSLGQRCAWLLTCVGRQKVRGTIHHLA
jgi:hypothetical protein